MDALRAYCVRVAVLLSQATNCVLLFGHPDQTVSARAFANRHRPAWGAVYRTINAVFFWQADHCRNSFEADIEFARSLMQRKERRHG